MKLAFLTPVMVAILSNTTIGKEWRGIVPLKSRRIDVERIFGTPIRAGSTSLYETPNEFIEVRYSTDPCKGAVLGWSVPADTVLELRVSPKKPERVTIEPSRFATAVGHVGDPYYVNLEEGLAYKLLSNRDIYAIVYFPSKRQNRLRCPGFPDYDAGLTQYRAFDTFGDIPLIDRQARLDNFAFSLENDPSSDAYVIVYAGRRAVAGEATTRATEAKRYLVQKRRIDSRRIKTIDGGYRESLETELFLIDRGSPAPTPTPTLSKNEVILRSRRERRGRIGG